MDSIDLKKCTKRGYAEFVIEWLLNLKSCLSGKKRRKKLYGDHQTIIIFNYKKVEGVFE